MNNYLLNKDFLRELFNQTNKINYIRIFSLDSLNNIQDELQGKISSAGNITIDGNSTIRRTCSFTFITNKIDINTTFWAQNSKFKLEVGVKNFINAAYDEIIWFSQGVFVVSSFNQVMDANGQCTITVQGKDKMCLLNGDCGGNFTAPVEFAFEEFYDGVNMVKNYILIKDIIFNLIHIFGKEPLQNIIINDLDSVGLEAQQYMGNNPMYLFQNTKTQYFYNEFSTNENDWVYLKSGSPAQIKNLNYLIENDFYSNKDTADQIAFNNEDNEYFYVIKCIKGSLVGYRQTPLTFPGGTLEVKTGESITSVLDNIIKIFPEYEYFYDLYGRFVFQKKNIYVNTFYSENKQKLNVSLLNEDKDIFYTFNNTGTFVSFTDTPDINNIKNDFVIWGQQDLASGATKDIHIRYAIDKKPVFYKRTDGEEKEYNVNNGVDWREIIYQMADDYFTNHTLGNQFYKKLIENNPNCINGNTGYEQYYTDIYGFWRNIYDEKTGFNLEVLTNPSMLNFWFDFIEGDSKLAPCSIQSLGDRPKVISDAKFKYLIDADSVPIIYKQENEEIDPIFDGKYTIIDLEDCQLSIYPTKKTLKQELQKLLEKHLLPSQSVTITALPIYILEPNTKILIIDNNNNINNTFIVNNLSISLQHNGTMNISAIKNN